MNEINAPEDRLRSEIEDLKRQLEEQKKLAAHNEAQGDAKPPSWRSLVMVVLLLAALAAGGYYFGYLPHQHRELMLAAETRDAIQSLPVVNVERVERESARSSLVLPGNIQAVTEAPVLARSSGYIRKRYVDIGDHVKPGQVLVEIEAPELQQQIKQATANIEQAGSSVQQAEAALLQARANLGLAQKTAERWRKLLTKGAVSRQDSDTYDAQFEAQQANVQALEKAVAAARSNVSAQEANLARLNELLGYLTVHAPFAGVITERNVDEGALVSEGNTLLFRIAQTDRLRTFLNVPQGDAPSVRVGQQATLQIPELPGRKFPAAVSRTASALDPSSRTLLVEVQAANPNGELLPGMYAQVDLAVPRKNPALMIPSDTLVMRSDGPQVAVVSADGQVHFSRIQLGRDLGDHLEVLSGIENGQQLAVNPSDDVREGARVKPVLEARAPTKK
jgi:multidrug efflux pump subunit AcrA (membrane-fusion protein)